MHIFHIEIFPAHRKFLRFAHRGKAYEYRVLPFGLSLAPRVFSKCVEAALSPLRSRGIRIFSYIDDYLICSHSREQALRDVGTVTSHLSGLGFQDKLYQKPSAARTMHLLSGYQFRLPQISCHAIGGEATVVQSVSGPVSTGGQRCSSDWVCGCWV